MSLENLEFQLAYLSEKAKAAKLEHMSAFAAYLRNPELTRAVDKDPNLFHKTLLDAEACDYIHYSRLSAGMGLHDSSNCSRWFQPIEAGSRKTPDMFKRRFAILALARIIERDIERVQQGQPPIGGLTIRMYPNLEIEVPFVPQSMPKPITAVISSPAGNS